MALFRAYDIRGIYEEELTEDVAERIGKAFATVTDADTIVVGRDNRTHGEVLADAFIDGAVACGKQVVDLGVVPNPVVTWYAARHGAGCVITASHNPKEWNGFKFRAADGRFLSMGNGLEAVQDVFEAETFDERDGGEREERDVRDDYIAAIAEAVSVEGMRVVVNCGNGTAGRIADLFDRLGCDAVMLNEDPDGTFPSYVPYPQHPEMRAETQAAVEEEDADLGIMFDVDCDRVGFITANGYLEGDIVYALLARHILSQEKGTLLYEVKHSQLAEDVIRENGGTPLLHRTGNSFIVNTLYDNPDILFGGELSGHYFFPLYNRHFDDGPFAAALFCDVFSALADPEEICSELASRYHTSEEYRLDVERVETVDGLRINTRAGWILLRPSNTEPKITVRFEAETEEGYARLQQIVDALQTEQ